MEKKTIELDSGIYEVRRLTVEEAMPLLTGGDMNFVELAKLAVWKDGQPAGDSINALYLDEFTQLVALVNEVNPIGGGDEGND